VTSDVDLPEGVFFERLIGPMFGLRYPSRKNPDLYVLGVTEDGVHCCQPDCSWKDFGYEELTDHMEHHAPRKDRRLFR
jgi:hypothetical protein